MTVITETVPAFTRLELRTAHGPVFRDISSAPPRDATQEEIPIIDIAGIYGDFQSRYQLSREIKRAAEGYGFFYIKNHGIEDRIIDDARAQALAFFQQTAAMKLKVADDKSNYSNGWSGCRTRRVSPTESADVKEGFIFSYDPKHDPEPKDLTNIPQEVQTFLHAEDFIWEGTSHLPDFKDSVLAHWQSCLTLSRRLVRIFALALDLSEDHFDPIITYPGADGALNFYPASKTNHKDSDDVGLGSHTDLQCFTLLWQDSVGGLQVLDKNGQWIKAPPVPGTFVVNIGDFLMRLSNDRFVSTVHRVFNRAKVDRLSMPFFFGFNFNATCSVLPTCVDENHPAKYAPISCGEWCKLRLGMAKVRVEKEGQKTS